VVNSWANLFLASMTPISFEIVAFVELDAIPEKEKKQGSDFPGVHQPGKTTATILISARRTHSQSRYLACGEIGKGIDDEA
ncbi:MAG TPA: hypothetical protein VER03_02140, partial [Bryobacteraceae bacterium]|nr:hypothetical protein [Bryobacteraceae bacterium]